MTLNPKDNVVEQVIQTYEPYRDTLTGEKRKRFEELMGFLYEFVEAINARGEPFPEEAAIMTLLLKQHIIIEELKEEVSKLRGIK